MAEEDEVRAQYPIELPGIKDPDGERDEDGNLSEPAIVQMYAPNEGQLAVLMRVSQQVSARGGMTTNVARNIGLMYSILDALFVDDTDKAWVDSLMVTGELDPSDALGLSLDLLKTHVAAEADKRAPKTGPVRRVASANRTKK
jgi:hypothetical protein